MKAKEDSTGPKRTELQRDSDMAFVAERWVMSVPIRRIAQELNARNIDRGYSLSHVQVYNDIKEIYERWKMDRIEFVDAKIDLELAKLDKIEAECWEAWERSKEGSRKTIIEGGEIINGSMSGGKLKSREVETTFGDTKFLDIIQKCIDRRAALLGLNAPAKKISAELSGLSEMSKEEIEKEIEEKWKLLT